jgi:micrococcal nuclease
MFTYRCEILQVIDGDTLDIKIDLGFDISIKERVRLHEVNTPEVYGKKSLTEGEAGQQASDFTKQWVAESRGSKGYFIYTSRKYNARDKYGRSLGYISFVSGENTNCLNDQLIEKGWAA